MSEQIRAGYKQTEIGVLPDDWMVDTLGRHATFRTGPFGSALHKADYVRGGIPVINPMHIVDGRFRPSSGMTISPSAQRRLRDFAVRSGDIVVGRRGDMGRCAVVGKDQSGWLCGTGSMIVRVGSGSPAFLQRILSSSRAIHAIEDASVGTTMVNLNQGSLAQLKVPFPPVQEQRAIADALGDVDALLDALDRLIAKKRDLKQATMQQLLTARTRLPGFTGEWQPVALGDVASFLKGFGLPKSALVVDGGDPCIHYGELFTQYGAAINQTLSRTNASRGSVLSQANDVLMPTSDVTPRGLAKASCVRMDDIILGGDILVIRSNRAAVNGTFLSCCVRYDADQVLRLVTGSTVYHLYAADMRKFRLRLPPLAEQRAIIGVLSDMDAEIAALEARRAKTRDLKQAMMQELLTGRTRLV